MSGSCISLSGSTQCPAFDSASISTNSSLYSDFPFMQDVSNLTDFDKALSNYVTGSYLKSKYGNQLGCQGDKLTADAGSFYARYTTSTLCNGLIQSSKSDCNLSDEESRPLCADTCALMATSEQEIVVKSDLCPGESDNYMSQIRSDFTVCALPADSLTGTCISGADNEPDECGYGPNMMGFCGYCASDSPNSTDTCCTKSNAASRCENVSVPTTTATLPPIFPSSTSNSTAGASGSHGLSGGQIAGAVVGSIAGFAILVALILAAMLCLRRRRRAESDTALNQPNPQRKGSPSMTSKSQSAFSFVPGGRVTRMSALREMPSLTSRRSRRFFGGSNKFSDVSDSEGTSASPGAISKRIPPVTGKRNGSLTNSSVFAGASNNTSPRSAKGGQQSSPEAVSSGQSERLSAFQDYYSQDSIHPGDRVAVLWAYQPRAGDEFSLDRGELLKVVGIWDDGWATGIRVPETAESYDFKHREQRDSGVSNGSHKVASPSPTGEIKAFPMVCVCLPQHWRKIIDTGCPEDESSP